MSFIQAAYSSSLFKHLSSGAQCIHQLACQINAGMTTRYCVSTGLGGMAEYSIDPEAKLTLHHCVAKMSQN